MNPTRKIELKQFDGIRQLSAINYFKGIKPKPSFKKKFFENEYLTKRLEWRLQEFESRYKSDEKIRFAPPSNQITEDFTSKLVLENLNLADCFDFDYNPKEDDLLEISMNYVFEHLKGHDRDTGVSWGFMLFEFRDGVWKLRGSNPGKAIYKDIAQGIVVVENAT